MTLLLATGMESGIVEFVASGGTLAIESTVKRSGAYALKWTPAFSAQRVTLHSWTAAAATDEVIVGIGRAANFAAPGTNYILLGVQVGASAWVHLVHNAAGTLEAFTGATQSTTSTSLGSVAFSQTANAYQHIEMRVKPDDSTGIVEVWVDGTRVLNLTNIDTLLSAGSTTRLVLLGCQPSNAAEYLDDVVIMDSTGSVNNALIGPTKIERLAPTSDLAANWTRSAGADSFALVDEVPVSSADNISSNVATTKDEWGMGNRTHTGQVLAVVATAVGINSDGGAAAVKLGVKSSGTENQSAAKSLGASTTFARHIVQVDPNTSALWTNAAVNAATMTVEVA